MVMNMFRILKLKLFSMSFSLELLIEKKQYNILLDTDLFIYLVKYRRCLFLVKI